MDSHFQAWCCRIWFDLGIGTIYFYISYKKVKCYCAQELKMLELTPAHALRFLHLTFVGVGWSCMQTVSQKVGYFLIKVYVRCGYRWRKTAISGFTMPTCKSLNESNLWWRFSWYRDNIYCSLNHLFFIMNTFHFNAHGTHFFGLYLNHSYVHMLLCLLYS